MEKRIFTFTDYSVDIEIADHDFKLDCSSRAGDKLVAVSEELRKLGAAVSDGEKTMADAIEYGHECIDALLGEGASKIIFANRDALIDDVADLLMWISQTVADFQANRGIRA